MGRVRRILRRLDRKVRDSQGLSWWFRFRYTPVQVRARRRNDQHLSAQNPSPKDLLIFLHRMASPRHLLLHRMMSTLRHYNLHPRRRTR
jgi:hypothetical protein